MVFFSTQQYHVPQTTYLLSKISPIKISSIPIQTKSQNTTFLQRIELLPYSCGNACFPIDCRHAPIKFCRKGTKNPWVTSESYETVEAAITITIKRNRLVVHITGTCTVIFGTAPIVKKGKLKGSYYYKLINESNEESGTV